MTVPRWLVLLIILCFVRASQAQGGQPTSGGEQDPGPAPLSDCRRVKGGDKRPPIALRWNGKALNTSRVQPEVERFVIYRLNKSTKQFLYFLARTIEITLKDDTEFIKIEQHYESGTGVHTDTSVLFRHTLIPVSYISRVGGQTESFEFCDGEVRANITASDGTGRSSLIPLEPPVINAVAMDEVIKSMPMKAKNSSAVFRAYNPGKQFFNVEMRVIDSTTITTALGEADVWVISLNGLAVPTKVWVTKETRKIVQQESVLPNGDAIWKVRLSS